ncbi:unnamed protein product [Adineta ricciae]|uniref:Tyrosine-protein phosphatase domain-containing protein n=1 Tax=Adineta ricciae TaxID=249248 RepID=A0A813U7W4_ADIRI|nr:unnamed protein product [Adineta ricciae]
MLLSLLVLLISIHVTATNGHSSNLTVFNRSLNNRTGNLYTPRRSNSIELLKKRIANRHSLLKINRTLLSLNTTTKRTTVYTVNTTLRLLTETTTATTNNDKLIGGTQNDLTSRAALLQAPATSKSSNSTLIVIIFIFCFGGFILLVFIFTFLLKEHINSAYFKLPCIHALSGTKQSRDGTPLFYSPIHSQIVVTGEFPVEQLYDIYVQKHAFDDLAFAIEFKSLPNFEELSCISATRSIVASKNRFLNILPIDATRVVLNTLNDDPATDYINGNYISGYKCANKFIATQGPKPDTCEDFWRMMWELKLKSIVMLTNTTEGASRMTKCHQYWPELDQTIVYGSYKITCIDKQCLCDYEKRYFQMSQVSCRKRFNKSNIARG